LAYLHFSSDCVIEHLEGMTHPANRPLRRPANQTGYESSTAWLIATLATATITQSYGDRLANIMAAQGKDIFATNVRPTSVDFPIAEYRPLQSSNGAMSHRRMI
jgi:hypothetical protein